MLATLDWPPHASSGHVSLQLSGKALGGNLLAVLFLIPSDIRQEPILSGYTEEILRFRLRERVRDRALYVTTEQL